MSSLTPRELHDLGALIRIADDFQIYALLPGEQEEILVAEGRDQVFAFLAQALAEID